ncbi:MAG: hypothetical protein EP330_07810 [Deltaproteobacteria bacterium]|nr:MAG: hypothetical protein EP330_07810 [Deltaproteobacteria bacterium]
MAASAPAPVATPAEEPLGLAEAEPVAQTTTATTERTTRSYDALDDVVAEADEAEEIREEAPAAPAIGGSFDMEDVAEVELMSKAGRRDVTAKAKSAKEAGGRLRKTPAAESAAADMPSAEGESVSLGSLRSQAMPRDLPSAPANASGEYTIAQDAADAYIAAGQPVEAANTLRTYVRSPAEEGMAHAARASELYYRAGSVAEASSVARTGLGLSTANSPWRSLLFVRLGDARAALGDVQGAEAAYRSAIELNQGR